MLFKRSLEIINIEKKLLTLSVTVISLLNQRRTYMETPCPYMVVEKEKNVNKHEARETGYANRDIQSGITFDRKILFHCKNVFHQQISLKF